MKLAITLSLILLASACTNTQDQGAGALLLADEVERLSATSTLWPEFEPMAVPLAIYDGERTYLFRHPQPPEGFAEAESAKRRVHIYEGRHPAVTANTSADISGTMTATLMLDDPGHDPDLTHLAAIALHETFHVYQREEHPGWQANEVDLFVYPTDDAELLALRRLETEALRRALSTSDPTESACWARQALALRGDRFAGMDTVFVAYERGTELNEGLATFVELRAEGLDTVVFPPGGFEATAVRRRAYDTGSAMALLLDRLQPGWPATFEADDRQSLDEALDGALGVESGAVSGRCVFSDSEISEAARTAREDVRAVLAAQVDRLAEFEVRSGWRVEVMAADGEPLWPQGFDPLNIERVQGGLLHLRFLRLGNGSGELEVLDAMEVDIETFTQGAGSHPLFNGIQRVVITGLTQPQVTVDGEGVTIQLSGLTATFERASVHESPGELLVKIKPSR